MLRSLISGTRALLHPVKRNVQIEDELKSFFEASVEDKVRRGMSPEEARRIARIEIGSREMVRHKVWSAGWESKVDSLAREFCAAARQLRKSPGFTLTAVLTLALGIGATTAIFTLVQQVMLQSLPVNKPDQLWRIGDQARCCNFDGYSQRGDDEPSDWSLFPWGTYKLFRANTAGFQYLAALDPENEALAVRRLGSSAPPERANGQYVSGNFFQTLGVFAWRGRFFTDADDRQGAPPVAVMSFHTWEEKYNFDPSVVGSTYQISGHPFTIIGVTPPHFIGATMSSGVPDIWIPLTTEPMIEGTTSQLKDPRADWLDLIGRVRPGTNPKALQAQLQGELHDWLASHVPEMNPQEKAVWRKQSLRLSPGGAGFSSLRANYGDGLLLLMTAACCVLLLVCANIANLLLARGLRKRQHTSIRVALGASRSRLVRNALLESVVLSLIGGAAGMALAWAGARLILHLAFHGTIEQGNWIPLHASPSIPVLFFALAVSVLTSAVFGIAPAWMTSHAEPVEALRGANRAVGGRHWGQKALVVAQAAASLVLLSAAAMLGSSLRNLDHQNFGFNPDGRYLVNIDPMPSDYKQEQLVPLFREIQDRLIAIPDVRSVSSATYAPMSGYEWTDIIRIEGKPEPGPKGEVFSDWTRVTPGFFDTIGAKILAGRPITEDDNETTRPVAVINEAFAKRYFGNQNPMGQHFGFAPEKNAGTYEIVGVAHNVNYLTWDSGLPARPMFYIPEAQSVHFDQPDTEANEIWSRYLDNIVIWAPGHPPNLGSQVKRALAEVDPTLVVYDVQPYSKVIQDAFGQQNMMASLAWLFGAIGLVVAAIGLYGVTAYSVEQRTSEIGVRMALGADRGSVIAMVLRGALWQVGLGLGIGIPGAVIAGHFMASQLYGVRPWDPVVLVTTTAVLAGAAFAAAMVPAQRAASVQPIRALRAG